MSNVDPTCPVSGCRTINVFYGTDEGYELTAYYCPRCDVAVGLLSVASGEVPDASVEWHRAGAELELRPEERGCWNDLSEQVRETWERCVRHFVATFLRDRTADYTSCPSDFADTRIVHVETDERDVKWSFSWCDQCNSGVLSAFDPDYGWELCFSVKEGANGEPYHVVLEHAPVEYYPTAREVLRRLPAVGPA